MLQYVILLIKEVNIMNIGRNIKRIRKSQNLTLEQVAKAIGTTRQTVSRYENNNISNIPMNKIKKLAAALNTTQMEILGIQDSTDYQPNKYIPVLGRISAGLPMYAEENIEEYISTNVKDDGEYFALRVKGDSMNAAHIFEGNLLIVRHQDMVENGEIAIVMINNEDATVKRFYCDGKTVTLMPQSTNPKHKPQIYDTNKTIVRIIGKVVKNEITFD